MKLNKTLLEKELFLNFSPLAGVIFLLFYFSWSIYFFSLYQEYQNIASQLAIIENKRGATQMLLLSAHSLTIFQIIAWSIFFGARSFALEFEWLTHRLFGDCLLEKSVVLLFSLALIILPFWLAVFFLGFGTNWDEGLLFGIFLSQIIFMLYASALAICVSLTLKQGISASLLLGIIWLLLYLLPTIIHEPELLTNLLQWFSPFSQTKLLESGIFHIQTLLFFILNGLFFISYLGILKNDDITC